jgi:hypothetical protein
VNARRLNVVAAVFIIALYATAAWSQSISTQAQMHARVQSLYGFSPAKVTAEQRESKSAEMDGFWKEVKANQATELPLLRKELQDTTNPAFFFADVSGLLLALSQSPEDEKLVAASLVRIDFQDFQSRQYLYLVHSLATRGIDVTAAALHMLDDARFEVYLPEHGAYRLDQAACLLEALLPLPEAAWVSRAVTRLENERDETASRSLLLLLFYAQTEEADRTIRSIADNANKPQPERDFARTILKHERELGLGNQPSHSVEVQLREERRKRMAGISDEAMDDLQDLTTKIARARTLRPVTR